MPMPSPLGVHGGRVISLTPIFSARHQACFSFLFAMHEVVFDAHITGQLRCKHYRAAVQSQSSNPRPELPAFQMPATNTAVRLEYLGGLVSFAQKIAGELGCSRIRLLLSTAGVVVDILKVSYNYIALCIMSTPAITRFPNPSFSFQPYLLLLSYSATDIGVTQSALDNAERAKTYLKYLRDIRARLAPDESQQTPGHMRDHLREFYACVTRTFVGSHMQSL